MKTYSRRTWLNRVKSAGTGNVVMFHGKAYWDKKKKDIFFSISDCHESVRLHPERYDKKMKGFIEKLRLIAKEANAFANWLEKTHG